MLGKRISLKPAKKFTKCEMNAPPDNITLLSLLPETWPLSSSYIHGYKNGVCFLYFCCFFFFWVPLLYILQVSIYHNPEQSWLKLGVAKAFLYKVLLNGNWQPCRSSWALGMVARPNTYHNLKLLPSRPCSAPQDAQFLL